MGNDTDFHNWHLWRPPQPPQRHTVPPNPGLPTPYQNACVWSRAAAGTPNAGGAAQFFAPRGRRAGARRLKLSTGQGLTREPRTLPSPFREAAAPTAARSERRGRGLGGPGVSRQRREPRGALPGPGRRRVGPAWSPRPPLSRGGGQPAEPAPRPLMPAMVVTSLCLRDPRRRRRRPGDRRRAAAAADSHPEVRDAALPPAFRARAAGREGAPDWGDGSRPLPPPLRCCGITECSRLSAPCPGSGVGERQLHPEVPTGIPQPPHPLEEGRDWKPSPWDAWCMMPLGICFQRSSPTSPSALHLVIRGLGPVA